MINSHFFALDAVDLCERYVVGGFEGKSVGTMVGNNVGVILGKPSPWPFGSGEVVVVILVVTFTL